MQRNISPYDRSNPESIYEYSDKLIGQSLHSLFGDKCIEDLRKGKGRLGQMVEELFFGYDPNNDSDADFSEAGLELKCTPLLKSKKNTNYRIKERLICTMIDYFSIVDTPFEESHLLKKCRLMLLLFYLHTYGADVYDFEFLFRVLWQLPEKDLLIIKKDYETISEKVRNGKAHLLSEGDTVYLGAARKGQKGDNEQPQPNSEVPAKRRAFSLKPAYMRYVLSHVIDSGKNYYSNYKSQKKELFELIDKEELKNSTFENIILNRFKPFIGLDYVQICDKLGIQPYQSKSKYADVAGLIASLGKSKRIADSEEFIKSGITLKTIRLQPNGVPKESMSFKNIDYQEIYDTPEWTESEAYEIFTTRFLFAVFKPVAGQTITLTNHKTGKVVSEQAYVLDQVFFWTMPAEDLHVAEEFWQDIRNNVIHNNIKADAFWKISDNRKFHVRPKAMNKKQLARNPSGGVSEKYCYWLNAAYVKEIIERESQNGLQTTQQ